MAQTKRKNIGKAVLIGFIVLIIIIIAGIIVTSLIFKNDDVTPSFMGYSVYVMNEDGMGDAVPKGSLVLVKNYSPSNENLGDAVLCENVKGYGTTVLRLANIVPNTETVIYQGIFDQNKNVVYDVEASNMVGQAISYDPTLGKIITFVTSIKGRAILVVVPLLILLLAELIIHLVTKNQDKKIKQDKLKNKIDKYKMPENSPLNPQKLSSHSTAPVTIEDFIFGREENLLREARENSPTIEIRNEKPQSLDFAVEKIKRERVEKAKTVSNEIPRENTVKIERVRVAPAKKSEAQKPEIKPEMVAEDVKPAVQEVKPQTEEIKPIEEIAVPEPVEIPTEPVEKASPAVEDIPDTSLERLIKLMEENEKLLKSLADKD